MKKAILKSCCPLGSRHRTDPKHLATVKECMIAAGRKWKGRSLLAAEDEKGQLVTITGNHRAKAAMELGIEIPVLVIELTDWSERDRNRVLEPSPDNGIHHDELAAFFAKLKLPEAAELMFKEYKLGGTKPEVEATQKPLTGGKPPRIKRVR